MIKTGHSKSGLDRKRYSSISVCSVRILTSWAIVTSLAILLINGNTIWKKKKLILALSVLQLQLFH